MRKLKLTHCFPATTLPHRKGPYRRWYGKGKHSYDYSYFDGKQWYFGAFSPAEAVERFKRGLRSFVHTEFVWQGVFRRVR